MQFTKEQFTKLTDYLNTHELSKGVGTKESACSIAAINLAISGKLTDNIPECMSLVVGRFVITLQDSIPHELRNSKEWKEVLPHLAGTGIGKEKEQLAIIIEWMWRSLALIQYIADANGFGKEWREMCELKTATAADAVARAADAAARAAWSAAADAAADAAAAAARAAAYAAWSAVADSADSAADAAAYAAWSAAADSAAYAAYAADAAARAAWSAAADAAADDCAAWSAAAREDFWSKADPVWILWRLVDAK